jgi:hypothetical protein
MCAEQGACVRRRSWAGYSINMFEFEFPTGTGDDTDVPDREAALGFALELASPHRTDGAHDLLCSSRQGSIPARVVESVSATGGIYQRSLPDPRSPRQPHADR